MLIFVSYTVIKAEALTGILASPLPWDGGRVSKMQKMTSLQPVSFVSLGNSLEASYMLNKAHVNPLKYPNHCRAGCTTAHTLSLRVKPVHSHL